MSDVVEGTAEDITEAPTVAHDVPGVELAPRTRRSEVIRPLDVGQLAESFQAYQELLPRLLTGTDYQDAGRGKRFVKKSGWRKIATAFDLDVVILTSRVERDHDGAPVRAEVIARAIAPSGRSMDGDGYCDVAEERFSGPRGNKSKLENDLRATACTRAKNRAISDLVGMGEVSAEEVGHEFAPTPVAVEASPEWKQAARNALAFLAGGDARATAAAFDAIGPVVTADVAQCVVQAAKAIKDARVKQPDDPAADPDVEAQIALEAEAA